LKKIRENINSINFRRQRHRQQQRH
jgi:hypothetical protein